jgi:arylsulfatase B
VTDGGKNSDLRGTKATLFEGGTKVDAFIYSPLLPSDVVGTVYSNLFHVTDWFPTLLGEIEYARNSMEGPLLVCSLSIELS